MRSSFFSRFPVFIHSMQELLFFGLLNFAFIFFSNFLFPHGFLILTIFSKISSHKFLGQISLNGKIFL